MGSPTTASACPAGLRRAAAIASVALLGLASAAVAHAADQARVAVDPDGDASYAWRVGSPGDGTERQIHLRHGDRNGALGVPDPVSPAGASADDPDVAVDAGGNAVYVWVRSNGSHNVIEARRRRANGALSAVQTISEPGEHAAEPEVAVDPIGHAVITWQRFNGVDWIVQARRRTRSGKLSSVRDLSATGRDAFHPQVGVDLDGDAVIAWRRFNGSDWIVQTRARAANGALSKIQSISKGRESARQQRVAVDADGDAVFAWDRDNGGSTAVQTRRRSADGTLSAIEDLSSGNGAAAEARVVVDPAGNAVFAWQRLLPASRDYVIETRASAAGGGPLSSVQQVSSSTGNGFSPDLGVDADGDAIIAWQLMVDGSSPIQTRARTASGTLSAIQDLTPAGQYASDPQVAVDSQGGAVFTWRRMVGDATVVETRRRTAPGALGHTQALSD